MNILPADGPQWEAIAAVRAQLLRHNERWATDYRYRKASRRRVRQNRAANRLKRLPRALRFQRRSRPPTLRRGRSVLARIPTPIDVEAVAGSVDPPVPGEPVPIARILPHVLAQIARGAA